MCQFAKDHRDESTGTFTLAKFSTLDFLPQNTLCEKAYEFTSARLPLPIFNHSIRVYLHAKELASKSPLPETTSDVETILFIASMFHDIGTNSEFNGPERFEVCGADAAVSFLQSHAPDLPSSEVHDIWIAIALHTSSGIAERISEFCKTIRLAVLIDFDRPGLRDEHGVQTLVKELEERFPRLDIEKVLGDAVVKQIMSKSEGEERLRKAPSNSWPGGLLRGELEKMEGFEGVNPYF